VRGGQGTFVYVIKEDKTVELRKVSAAGEGDSVSVESDSPPASWWSSKVAIACATGEVEIPIAPPARRREGKRGERRGQAAPQRGA